MNRYRDLTPENIKWMLASEKKSAVEVLANAKATLVRAVEEVERMQARLLGEPYGLGTVETVEAQTLNEAVHFLTSYINNNVRFDLMLTHAVRIEKWATLLEALSDREAE